MIVRCINTGVLSEAYRVQDEAEIFSVNNYLREPLQKACNSHIAYITVQDRRVTGYYSYIDFYDLFIVIDAFFQIPKAIMDNNFLFGTSCDDSSNDTEEFTLGELINKLDAIYGFSVLDKSSEINLSLRLRVFSEGADAELFAKQLRIETAEEFEQRKTENYYKIQNLRSERISKLKKEAKALGIELTEEQLEKLEN